MKTIVSLALAGLISISALLPVLAAQEAENVSIPESSGISESMAQDESSVSSSGSLADGSAASSSNSTEDGSAEPESGSNAEDGSDSVPQPESGSTPAEADSSIFEDSETETSSSLPVSESTVSDETESATDSETAESDTDAEDEDSSGVMEAAADLEYDNVTLPGTPQEAIDQFKKRNGLPEFCCCLLPGTEMPVLVRYGERSYVPLEVREPGERAEETAGRLNGQLGVTKQQQAAMLWGSMFGWDIPAADPARYDEQGLPKRHEPKHGDRQR